MTAATVVVGGVAATMLASSALASSALASPGPMLIATQTVITGTSQQPNDSLGAVLKVNVQVTSKGGSSAPTGDVIVNAGPSNNCAAAVSGPLGSTVSTGSCEVHNLADQTYGVYGAYRGSGNWSASSTGKTQVTLSSNTAPAITSSTPPEKATVGEDYQFTFSASGNPAPAYKLDANAPSWLSINGSTGAVSGTVPWALRGSEFTYSVIASNSVGTATAGPYTVDVTRSGHSQSDVVSSLTCSGSVTIGRTGSCTLTVTNDGSSTASGVTAAIALPSQLSARSCGHSSGWGWLTGRNGGCTLGGNTATWQIGSLAAGASKAEKVTFTAKQGGYASGFGHHHRWNSVTVRGFADTASQSASKSKATVVIHPRSGWFW
jgi:hypothetical protein